MEEEVEGEGDSADEDGDGGGEGDATCVVVSPYSQHHLDSPPEESIMSQRRARAMMLASRLASSSLSLSMPVTSSPSQMKSSIETREGMGMGMEGDDCHEVSCTDDSSSVATLINAAGEREECDTFLHDHGDSNNVREGGRGEDGKELDVGEDADDPLRNMEGNMSERRERGSPNGDDMKMTSSEIHTAISKSSGIQGSRSPLEHDNKNSRDKDKEREKEKDKEKEGDGKPRYVYRESKYILSK